MTTLRMTETQHRSLCRHLHDGTGLEAVAIALCGRGPDLLTVYEIIEIPPDECSRTPTSVVWPTRLLRSVLERAAADGLGVLKIHSHPTGVWGFSTVDDASDKELFDAVHLKAPGIHATAVMLPDGDLFARLMNGRSIVGPVDRIVIVGDLVSSSHLGSRPADQTDDGFDVRNRQAFGDRTIDILGSMSFGIVGASGTGSPIAEMLARLEARRIVLVEPDIVESKNLNRIWGSCRSDADAGTGKGAMLKTHIEAIGLGTVVEVIEGRVETPAAISLLSTCDFVFGCVDSVEGRDSLNRIATFYILPYIDVGVRLDADGDGGIESVSAGVHYITPGGSSLRTRGVYTDAELHAEYLKRTDPAFYDDQVRRGYIRGVDVDRPAVISINTAVAAAAVNEMLARLHPFRSRPNGDFAIQKLLFTHGRIVIKPDGAPDEILARHVGRGDASPLLLSPRFGLKK